MTILDYWLLATGQSVCAKTDCKQCHEVYTNETMRFECPLDVDVPKEKLLEFVHNVTEKICERYASVDFEMTEDELVDILMGV